MVGSADGFEDELGCLHAAVGGIDTEPNEVEVVRRVKATRSDEACQLVVVERQQVGVVCKLVEGLGEPHILAHNLRCGLNDVSKCQISIRKTPASIATGAGFCRLR